MASYVGINVSAIFGAFDDAPPWASWVLAVAVSLPIAAQIWATLSLIRESDEFVAALIAKQFILASGIAMALFSAWGFAESYADAPHAPGWLIYPLFWGVFGVAAPFIRSSGR